MRDKRSILNFGILIVFALLVTLFVTSKANEAIEEINALSATVYNVKTE